jgi:hypothetical protein
LPKCTNSCCSFQWKIQASLWGILCPLRAAVLLDAEWMNEWKILPWTPKLLAIGSVFWRNCKLCWAACAVASLLGDLLRFCQEDITFCYITFIFDTLYIMYIVHARHDHVPFVQNSAASNCVTFLLSSPFLFLKNIWTWDKIKGTEWTWIKTYYKTETHQ